MPMATWLTDASCQHSPELDGAARPTVVGAIVGPDRSRGSHSERMISAVASESVSTAVSCPICDFLAKFWATNIVRPKPTAFIAAVVAATGSSILGHLGNGSRRTT